MENKLSAEKQAEAKAIGENLKAQGVRVDNTPPSTTPTNTPNMNASTGGNTTGGIQQNYQPSIPQKSRAKTKGRSL